MLPELWQLFNAKIRPFELIRVSLLSIPMILGVPSFNHIFIISLFSFEISILYCKLFWSSDSQIWFWFPLTWTWNTYFEFVTGFTKIERNLINCHEKSPSTLGLWCTYVNCKVKGFLWSSVTHNSLNNTNPAQWSEAATTTEKTNQVVM